MAAPCRVLFVSLSPLLSIYSSSIRNRMLVEGLLKRGCQVTVLSMESRMVPYKKWEAVGGFIDSGFLRIVDVGRRGAENQGISLDRLRKTGNGLLTRIFKKISPVEAGYFVARSFDVASLGNDSEFDIVISSSDPKASHFFVRKLIHSGIRARRWIQYWGDPYLLDITLDSLLPRSLIRFLEHGFLKAADKVVYTSPLLSQAQRSLYPDCASKIYDIPTAAERKDNWPFPSRPPFVIGYHGSYYSNFRNIEPLVRACESLAPLVRLEIVGSGDSVSVNPECVSLYEPTANIADFERMSHALVLLCNKTGLQLPGKFYHVAGTNRPAIAIVDGEYEDLWVDYLTKFERFVVCKNNVDSIASAIMEIMDRDNLGHDYPVALDPCVVAERFLSTSH